MKIKTIVRYTGLMLSGVIAISYLMIAPSAFAKPDGLYKSYYENGNLQREGTYKDDKAEGLFKSYFEDGKLRDESTYKDDKLEGRRKTYYPNGRIQTKEFYRDDLPDGRILRFREDGTLEFLDTYRGGKKINRKTYDADGVLQFDNNYEEE